MTIGKTLSSRAVSKLEAQYSANFVRGVTLDSALGDVRDLIATVRALQTDNAVLQNQVKRLEQQVKEADDVADDMFRDGINAGASGQVF